MSQRKIRNESTYKTRKIKRALFKKTAAEIIKKNWLKFCEKWALAKREHDLKRNPRTTVVDDIKREVELKPTRRTHKGRRVLRAVVR
ncbi:hypothetical protein GWN42_13410 [candidate division KSB1 bacterium]|nr:hypothetical protein [candidate division KSB1 bacterium]